MCPPRVGGSYCLNRACTLHCTCSMDHRVRNATASSRRTRGRPVPVAAAHQRTRLHTTNCKRTSHPDATRNDTNGNTHPTPRPRQKRAPTSNFRTTSPDKQNQTKTALGQPPRKMKSSNKSSFESEKIQSSKKVPNKFIAGYHVRKSSNPSPKEAYRKHKVATPQRSFSGKRVPRVLSKFRKSATYRNSLSQLRISCMMVPLPVLDVHEAVLWAVSQAYAPSCIVIADVCGEGAFFSRPDSSVHIQSPA